MKMSASSCLHLPCFLLGYKFIFGSCIWMWANKLQNQTSLQTQHAHLCVCGTYFKQPSKHQRLNQKTIHNVLINAWRSSKLTQHIETYMFTQLAHGWPSIKMPVTQQKVEKSPKHYSVQNRTRMERITFHLSIVKLITKQIKFNDR